MPTISNKSARLGLVEALNDYRTRRSRNAFLDGAAGGIAASCILAELSFAAWKHEMNKHAAQGKRPKQPKPLSGWVRAITLPLAREYAIQSDIDLPLLREPFLFEQLTSDRPLRVLRAQLDAFVVNRETINLERLIECGEEYRAALANADGAYARALQMAADHLGVLAAFFGGHAVRAAQRDVDGRKNRPGRPMDVLSIAFIIGVSGTYARAQLGCPKPLDLAEMAVVWGLDEGPRDEVLRRWNRKLEQFRRRFRAGKPQANP